MLYLLDSLYTIYIINTMNTQANINVYIGSKIRTRRKELSLSQKDLAKSLDVSYQQVQRYENGENALAIEKLLQIANSLKVSPDFFYNGAPNTEIAEVEEDPIIEGKPSGIMNILFIDDSKEDEVLFRNAVKNYEGKININCIREPEMALSYLDTTSEENPIHLVFLDINMPRINGLELLKKIKKNENIANIPIIMLTNSVRVKEMQESYKNHASGFIQKTTDFDAYCKDIQKTLNYWLETVVLPA